MITKIRLKNWRSHLDSEVNFSEGTNCFIGTMGAGKTSILDAMCFAFFGTFPTLQAKKLKLEDIVMKKPKEMKEAEVSVNFNIANDQWSVKRNITNGRSTAELRKNNTMIEGPQSSKVTTEIENLLKINYDLFTRAIYSEQNQLDMFLTIPKGQRMKKIDELLSIDKFEKARMTVKALKNKSSTILEDKKGFISSLQKDENLSKVETFRSEIENLKKNLKELETELKIIKDRRGRVLVETQSLKDKQKKLLTIDEEVKTKGAMIGIMKEDVERLKEELFLISEKTQEQLLQDYSNTDKVLNEIKLNLEKEKKNLDRVTIFYIQKEAKLILIENEKIAEKERQIKEREELESSLRKMKQKKIEEDLDDKRKSLQALHNKVQKAEAFLEQINSTIEEIVKLKDCCPLCETKITESKKKSIIESKREQIEKHNKDKDHSKVKIVETENEINGLEKLIAEAKSIKDKIDRFSDAEKELKFLKDALKQLRIEIDEHGEEKKMLQKTVDMLQNSLEDTKKKRDDIKKYMDKKKEADDKIKRIREYEITIAELEKERIKYSDFSLTLLEGFEKELQTLIGKEKQDETKIDNLNVMIKERENRYKEINEKLNLLNKYKDEVTKLEKLSNDLYFLENSLVSTQEQLRKNFVDIANQAMKSIWPDLYPYKDFYGVRLGIIDGDYILQLEDSTGWINADGVASGGERSIACLALRIAFALVLAPQLRWLVLDEPTHNLDSRAVEDLAVVLRDRVSEFVDQIFLITHDPALESAVSGYLYRLEREKEKDGYTKVNKIAGPEKI